MNDQYKNLSDKELKEIFEDMEVDYWVDYWVDYQYCTE